jgi:hypothetical protein
LASAAIPEGAVYITYPEHAALRRCTPASLYALYAQRRPYLPPKYKVGGRVLFKLSEVLASIDACRVG